MTMRSSCDAPMAPRFVESTLTYGEGLPNHSLITLVPFVMDKSATHAVMVPCAGMQFVTVPMQSFPTLLHRQPDGAGSCKSMAAPVGNPAHAEASSAAVPIPTVSVERMQTTTELQSRVDSQAKFAGMVEHDAASAVGQPSQSRELPILGNVWVLAQDRHGSRRVQRALDEAGNDTIREELVKELKGHVLDAMACPHANFVLQKCIVASQPLSSQFVIDELKVASAVGKAARHKYACRIVQRLFEQCCQEQVEGLVDDLIVEAVSLSKHAYGNYVMQHVLKFGSNSQKRRTIMELVRRVRAVGSDGNGCAVVAHALNYVDKEDQRLLIRAILDEEGLIANMAIMRHGHVAATLILQTSECSELEEARRQLANEVPFLTVSRYGRFVLGHMNSSHSGSEPV